MNSKLSAAALWLLDLGLNVVVIFALVMIIQTWLIAPFDVFGASMCNTLNYMEDKCVNDYGEKIIINEAAYIFGSPERGDIVVFKPDNGEDKYFIKRVIGLPGETVEIEDGKVFVTTVDGQKSELEENYLNENNKGKTKAYFSDLATFNVPEGKYFLLGDNRNASTDSRSCFGGNISSECRKNPDKAYVPKESIRGKTWVVWWPIGNLRVIEHQKYGEPN